MSYEQHLEVKIGNIPLPMIRRPVAIQPKEGTVGAIDFGTFARIEKQRVGLFRKGEWRTGSGAALKEQPTHWTSFFKDKTDVPA
jgi:hypothetical protein